jgi:hypothetical protein
MSDFDPTDPLATSFAQYRAELIDEVALPGTAAAHATVAHRRKVRAVVTSVVALAVIATPTAVYAAFDRGPHAPNPGPGTSVEQSESPSPSPSPDPSPDMTTSQAATAPDGRISTGQLGNATITVPAWKVFANACPSGNLTFVNGRYPEGTGTDGAIFVQKIVYANLDGDPAIETAALFRCTLGNTQVDQVLAFDRDTAGKIVNLGLIVQSVPGATNLIDLTVAPAGGVQVNIGNYKPCCMAPREYVRTQWRRYGWDGHGISQVGGPTAFAPIPNITDLSLTASDLVFGPVQAGKRHAVLTLTVRNNGNVTSQRQRITLLLRFAAQPAADGWTGCTSTLDGISMYIDCGKGALAPGGSYVLRLGFTMADAAALPTTDKPNVWLSSVNADASKQYWDLFGEDNGRDIAARIG